MIPLPTDATVRAMFRTTLENDLRDRFAGQALEAAITAGHDVEMRGHKGWRDELARESYRYADAMLRTREVTP